MILRESDAGAWTADPGGTLEQRRYYCQNWRSDTSVVLTDTGKMVESVKYSSYGVPFAMPAGDTDSDGDWDATDDGVIAADVPNTDARRDVDLDGDVDAADITQANGAKSGYYATGRGILSAIDNRKGYAGYESASEFESSTGRHLSHIRNRVYDADLGRWTRRDPLGYVDGMGLYEYCTTSPLLSSDPDGTVNKQGQRAPCLFSLCTVDYTVCIPTTKGVAVWLTKCTLLEKLATAALLEINTYAWCVAAYPPIVDSCASPCFCLPTASAGTTTGTRTVVVAATVGGCTGIAMNTYTWTTHSYGGICIRGGTFDLY